MPEFGSKDDIRGTFSKVGHTHKEINNDVDFNRHQLKNFIVHRMTAAERAAIASPKKGMLVQDTDGTEGYYSYNGGWVNINLIEDASAPTSKADGYISVVAETLWYFTDGNRYKLTATLDNPAANAGEPMGLGGLVITYP